MCCFPCLGRVGVVGSMPLAVCLDNHVFDVFVCGFEDLVKEAVGDYETLLKIRRVRKMLTRPR